MSHNIRELLHLNQTILDEHPSDVFEMTERYKNLNQTILDEHISKLAVTSDKSY